METLNTWRCFSSSASMVSLRLPCPEMNQEFRLLGQAKGSRTGTTIVYHLERITFSVLVAVFVEGLLFAFHLHGRSALDIHVHQLLIITIAITFVSVVNEWKHRNNVLAVVFRSLCFLIQGTWFIQVINSGCYHIIILA